MDHKKKAMIDAAHKTTLAALMAEMYPIFEAVVIGGCDDPECDCGGNGPQEPEVVILNPAVN